MATQRKMKPVTDTYTEGIGRRKTAIARVRVFGKGTGITVNDKDYRDYFKRDSLVEKIHQGLKAARMDGKVKVNAHVFGGGIQAQAEAVRHGIARALVKAHPDIRTQLRSKDLLTRDPRMKERRKFGLKKARRAPQWSKR